MELASLLLQGKKTIPAIHIGCRDPYRNCCLFGSEANVGRGDVSAPTKLAWRQNVAACKQYYLTCPFCITPRNFVSP